MTKNTIQTQGFIEALEQDSRLQAQFALAAPNSLSGVVDFASAAGFNFTKAELEAALKDDTNNSIVGQLRQCVGCTPTENGIIRNLFSRYFGFKYPSPQPGSFR